MVGKIRLAQIEDAEQISAIYSRYVLETPVSFESVPPSSVEMAARIAQILEMYPWLVYEIDGVIAGYAYASQHRARHHYQWSVDVTVYIQDQFQRQGIGRALYSPLLAILPLQGYVSAYAGITLPNAASVGLHESMGFKPVGVYENVGHKLGRWHNVGWWQRPLAAPMGAPQNPLELSAVQDLAEWKAALAV